MRPESVWEWTAQSTMPPVWRNVFAAPSSVRASPAARLHNLKRTKREHTNASHCGKDMRTTASLPVLAALRDRIQRLERGAALKSSRYGLVRAGGDLGIRIPPLRGRGRGGLSRSHAGAQVGHTCSVICVASARARSMFSAPARCSSTTTHGRRWWRSTCRRFTSSHRTDSDDFAARHGHNERP